MPEKATLERARRDKREGKAPTTQAGEFVREEMHHIREGKHGARSTKQAIAIGLSKARKSGVDLAAPKSGQARKSANTAMDADAVMARATTPRRLRRSGVDSCRSSRLSCVAACSRPLRFVFMIVIPA